MHLKEGRDTFKFTYPQSQGIKIQGDSQSHAPKNIDIPYLPPSPSPPNNHLSSPNPHTLIPQISISSSSLTPPAHIHTQLKTSQFNPSQLIPNAAFTIPPNRLFIVPAFITNLSLPLSNTSSSSHFPPLQSSPTHQIPPNFSPNSPPSLPSKPLNLPIFPQNF